jgi:protein-L-isoaspartate(D-aspartate) O-methyltransferase
MDTEFATGQMVRQQVRAWDVFDAAVLDVFQSVRRQNFVPPHYRDLAFADTEIPLAFGQKMMTPTMEGKLLQALALTNKDSVLEIGTGSAFLTACLSKLTSSVLSIDIFDDFVSSARDKLAKEGIDNVHLQCLDASHVLPEGEFDAIAVTASIPVFDDRLVSRLRPGGRLFVVVGSRPIQEARLITRGDNNDWDNNSLFETSLAPLINSVAPATFPF